MFSAQNKMSMDKEKYKERLHTLVMELRTEPELLIYLQDEVNQYSDGTSAFIKLQRKKLRNKGRLFYEEVSNCELRNKLVDDYAMMLWYKMIGDIPQMFTHILFQIENMLCHYISNDFKAYDKIMKDPEKYVYTYYNDHTKNTFQRKAKEYFFLSDGKRQPLKNINIWAKYVYWFVETGKTIEYQNASHSLVSDIVNIRNTTEHRNSSESISPYILKQISYWKAYVDERYNNVNSLLSEILKTIV